MHSLTTKMEQFSKTLEILKEKNRKTRRGKPRKNALVKFKMLLNNVRGFKTRQKEIKRIILEENPVAVSLVETNLKAEDVIDIPGYIIVRNDRKEEGGGVLFAYKQCFEHSIIVSKEYNKH